MSSDFFLLELFHICFQSSIFSVVEIIIEPFVVCQKLIPCLCIIFVYEVSKLILYMKLFIEIS